MTNIDEALEGCNADSINAVFWGCGYWAVGEVWTPSLMCISTVWHKFIYHVAFTVY